MDRTDGAMVSRRDWLGAAMACAAVFLPRRLAGQSIERQAMEGRIARVVQEYGQQGFHRTGTDVDARSGDWLFEEITRIGLTAARESFPLDRVDPVSGVLVVGDRRIEGLPLFDGAFTTAAGVRGTLGALGSDSDIGVAEAAPNTAGAGALGDARRNGRHAGIVCITRGGRPGLCPNNADSFTAPFGPPVLQVSSEHASWVTESARAGAEAHLIALATRTPATSFNVTATVGGVDSTLPPVVVMTPRSGWYACASERGGGVACWLELARALRANRPPRDVVFVASSGHELGHLGINAFVDRRPDIVRRSAGWMHFGANIGAAIDPGTTIQASDDRLESILEGAMVRAGLRIDRRNPRGTIPNGEAEVVHRGGGRYLSVIGRNGLFHNPDDSGAHTVIPAAIATFVDAFIGVAASLSARN